jgi:hypothetical protein
MLLLRALARHASLNRMQSSDVPPGRSRGTRYRWGTCSICRQAVRAGDIANLPPNVRLLARAARGASSCKPLFGGTTTVSGGRE